jgi:hypothetical protein
VITCYEQDKLLLTPVDANITKEQVFVLPGLGTYPNNSQPTALWLFALLGMRSVVNAGTSVAFTPSKGHNSGMRANSYYNYAYIKWTWQ